MRTIIRISTALCLLAVSTAGRSQSTTDTYQPLMPAGYRGEVVLRIGYGKAPDKIGVQWGTVARTRAIAGEGEYIPPASATNMRVIGDRFYFIDETANRIKVFRSPGTPVWQSDRFKNLGYYAVAPDGKVYAVWDSDMNTLSCLDSQGKLLWTKTHVVTKDTEVQLGLTDMLDDICLPEWTDLGLTAIVVGTDGAGTQRRLAVVLDDKGNVVRDLPGSVVGVDGSVYSYRASSEPGVLLAEPVTRTDAHGAVQLLPRGLGVDHSPEYAGVTGLFRVVADPAGGFIMQAPANVPETIKLNTRLETRVQSVLLRFDSQGRLYEHWRFPATKFGARYSELVPGTDGAMYHLRFGETGVEVVRYAHR